MKKKKKHKYKHIFSNDQELLDLERSTAFNSLYYFTKHTLNYKDLQPKPHQELADLVQSTASTVSATNTTNTASSKNKKMLILAPRGSFKSTITTIGFPLFLLQQNPNLRILLESATNEKSVSFLREIKHHITGNPNLKLFNGQFATNDTDLWQDDKISIATRTIIRKEPTISCSSVKTPKTGLHPDVIIVDDLVDEKNTQTSDQIDKTINHFKALIPMLEPGGTILVVGTRWHFRDLYSYIIQQLKDEFNFYIKAAIYKDKSLYFPQRLSMPVLDSIRKTIGPTLYSSQYMNNPVSDETAPFKQEHIQFFTPHSDKYKSLFNWFILVDPAITEKQESDSSAIIAVGISPTNHWFVDHVSLTKEQPHKLIQTILKVASMYPYKNIKNIVLESIGFQRTIKHFLMEECKKRSIYYPLEEIKGHSFSKEYRIRGLEPYLSDRKVFFNAKSLHDASPSMLALFDQLLTFPKCVHDDAIDALAFLPGIAYNTKRMVNAIPVKHDSFDYDDNDFTAVDAIAEITGYGPYDRNTAANDGVQSLP